MRILSLLRNLANGDLVSVADVDKLHYHRGISPEASTRSVALAEAQYLQLHAPGRPPKRDLFWLEEGGAYCLSPLLRRADAEDSQQFRLFFLDDVKTEERRLVYLTYGFITRCDTADAKPGFHTTAVLEDRDVLLVDYENLRDRFRSKTRTPKRKPHSAPPQATGEQQKGRILRLARS